MLRNQYAERKSRRNSGQTEDYECFQEIAAGTGYNGGFERREFERRATTNYLPIT